MSFGLSDPGERLHFDGGYVGQDIEITVYLDSTDDLDDTSTLSDVTTEPNITRKTVTIQSSDIEKFSGDFGFEKNLTLDIEGLTGEVDGVLLINADTNEIIGRAPILEPQPGPAQSLDGLNILEITPRITND